MELDVANGHAWEVGRAGLERALLEGLNYAFETTLGASRITGMLLAASKAGAQVHVWYAGLSSPELHMQRVKSRVASGGHDIAEHKIRERYDSSRGNLIKLLPGLASLRLYDNSADGDPKAGKAPRPVLLLHMQAGRIVSHVAVDQVPQWAKPILARAFEASGAKRPRR